MNPYLQNSSATSVRRFASDRTVTTRTTACLGLILMAALAYPVGSAGAADFRVKPYIQNPTQDAMTVMWLSDSNVAGSLTVTGVGTFNSAPVAATNLYYPQDEITYCLAGVDPGTPYLHRIRVPNLSASTTYAYSVTQGSSTFEAQFRTACAATGSVRFIVYADSETEPESTGKTNDWSEPLTTNYTRKYVADQTAGYQANLAIIRARAPDFVGVAGDLVEAGGEQRDWDEFWRHNSGVYGDLAAHAPILPAAGNHENYTGPYGKYVGDGSNSYSVRGSKAAMARYKTYFETPDNGSGNPAFQDYFYRMDYGPVTFITLYTCNGLPNGSSKDSNWDLLGEGENDGNGNTGDAPDFNPGSTQYTWLESQLSDAKANGRFIFIQFHAMPYSSGPHGYPPGSGYGGSNGSTNDRLSGVPVRVLSPLFEQYGVVAVLTGHDEMYEHSVANGVHYYDLGTGGDGLRGPYMGTDGRYHPLLSNTNQVFLAHLGAPEVWSGARLVSGGKHYGHLEINVWLDTTNHVWRAELSPAYAFPLMNDAGVVTNWERRVYTNDVIRLNLRQESRMTQNHGIPYDWMEAYGLDTTNETGDADGDGARNWEEYVTGTNPTNKESFFRVLDVYCGGLSNRLRIVADDATGNGYASNASFLVWRSTNLLAAPVAETNWVAQSGSIPRTTPTNVYEWWDTQPPEGCAFYRAGTTWPAK